MSWDDLDQRKRVKSKEDDAAPDPIDEVMAQIFLTNEGHKILVWLRQKSKERVLPPSAPESALRHLEGMRHLVHEIETRIARGRKEPDAGRTREQLSRYTSPAGDKRPRAEGRSRGFAGRLARKLLGR